MDAKAVGGFVGKHKKLIFVVSVAVVILYLIFGAKAKQTIKEHVGGTGNITNEDRLRLEIEGLKKSQEEMRKQMEQQQQQKKQQEPAKGQKEKPSGEGKGNGQSLSELERMIKPSTKLPSQPGQGQPNGGATQIQALPQKPSPPRLIKIDISEIVPAEKTEHSRPRNSDLFLPAPSFASFTTITEAYGPETGEQMPVSGVIDNAFTGPNKSKIPLRGCLWLGKARGVIGEKCADIKVTKISCVWPDGSSFEADVAGWVTAANGDFCLPGRVERHSWEFFKTVGITSFIEGISTGLSRAQETTSLVGSGQAVESATNITGGAFKYGLSKGALDLASAAKQFYAAQLQSLIPSVHVPAGTRGYLHITKGVRITGGRNALSGGGSAGYFDSYDLSSVK